MRATRVLAVVLLATMFMACGDEPEPCSLTLTLQGGQPTRFAFDVASGETLEAALEVGLRGACTELTVDGLPERSTEPHVRGFQVKADLGKVHLTASLASQLEFWFPNSATYKGPPMGTVYVPLIYARAAKELATIVAPPVGMVLVMISVTAGMSSTSRIQTTTLVLPVDLCSGCLTTYN